VAISKINEIWRKNSTFLGSLNKYLALKEGSSLHLLPTGAIIFLKEAVEFSSSMVYINRVTTELLLKCNGSKRAYEIINELYEEKEENYLRIFAPILSLIKVLEEDYIHSYEDPIPISIRITGSTDYHVPTHMAIELTSGCNLRCVYCYRESGPERYEKLPTQELLATLKSLAQHGIRVIELTGGEPFVHPDFLEILNFCVNHFELVAILTNGCLINEGSTRKIAQCKSKIIVSISLNGSNPKIHDALTRVEGSFKKTTKAIHLLADKDIRFGVAMCVTSENVDDIENTLLLAKELGAKWFGYSPALDLGRGKDLKWCIDFQQIKELTNCEESLANQCKGFLITMPEYASKIIEESGCGAGHRSFVLGSTGNVRPCVMFPDQYITFGNLLENTIEEVFRNPLIERFHNIRPPNNEICEECEYQQYCRFCIVRGLNRYESIGKVCKWARATKIDKVVNIPGKQDQENKNHVYLKREKF